MVDTQVNQSILGAIEKVEHPAIAISLLDLGMLKDTTITPDGKVTLTLVLPFSGVPDNIREYLIQSLASGVQSEGGEIFEVKLAYMNDQERDIFLIKEKEHWRG